MSLINRTNSDIAIDHRFLHKVQNIDQFRSDRRKVELSVLVWVWRSRKVSVISISGKKKTVIVQSEVTVVSRGFFLITCARCRELLEHSACFTNLFSCTNVRSPTTVCVWLKFMAGRYLCEVCIWCLPACVWGPQTWSALCQMCEAVQREPLGVLFHLLSCNSGADMQIRRNERSLCGTSRRARRRRRKGGRRGGGLNSGMQSGEGECVGKRWDANSVTAGIRFCFVFSA